MLQCQNIPWAFCITAVLPPGERTIFNPIQSIHSHIFGTSQCPPPMRCYFSHSDDFFFSCLQCLIQTSRGFNWREVQHLSKILVSDL